jgi:adenine-specific DNA-methyltransferase
MDGHSLDIVKEKLEQLKKILPEAFTEGRVDWEKLKVALGEHLEFSNERYTLNWAGKSHAYRLLQTPTYATLIPAKEESLNFDTTENLFIEGDNLEVLKILQKAYFRKIKMIYIDPPYNTGNDFIYKDNFSETTQEYQEKVGDIDKHGNATKARLFRNTKDNGRYHSNWLSMMLPRLFIARNLLRDDGVIFVSIDDNEVHNLRLLMDEIFGEENFVGEFLWKKNKSGNQNSRYISIQHEYIIAYIKQKDLEEWAVPYSNDDLRDYKERDTKGLFYWKTVKHSTRGKDIKFTFEGKEYFIEKCVYSAETIKKMLKDGEAEFRLDMSGNLQLYKKQRLGEGTLPYSFLDSDRFPMTEDASEQVINLFGGKKIFENPKPTELIKYLIQIVTGRSGTVLDFFAGSGTTAHAVMELNKEDGGNRKFILVQLPEPCNPDSEAYKAGYNTIADICKARLRHAAQKIAQDLQAPPHQPQLQFEEPKKLDLGFKVFKLSESHFKQWRPSQAQNAETVKSMILDFADNIQPHATIENILYELMLKNGKPLTEKIEKKNGYYMVGEKEIVLMLEEINEIMIRQALALRPQKVIALDKCFNGNDQLKINLSQQFRDAGIHFTCV